ncbi:MAG: 6-pyruvoyl-tetrahydropterin synthase-related protein [Candidatus Norongarragalinales archaeon]
MEWNESAFFLLLLSIACLFATSAWKGEQSIPANLGTDIGFHAYGTWFAQHQFESGNFDFSFDFFTNSVFSRTYPPFFYFLSGAFAVVMGVWNSLSFLVFVSYFLLASGVFFLAKKLGLQGRFAFVAALAALLSFPLAVEARLWGSLTRVFAYALLPWILLCAESLSQKFERKALAALSILFAVALSTHPLSAAYFIFISFAWVFLTRSGFAAAEGLKRLALAIAIAILASSFFLLPFLFEFRETHLARYLPSGAGNVNPVDIAVSLFQREFSLETVHSLYLGFSVAALCAVFFYRALKEKTPHSHAILALLAFFLLDTLFPQALSPLNQTLSRPAFFLSFFAALAAGFASRAIEARFSNVDLPRWFAIALVTMAIALDLNPLAIPAPSYSFPVAPVISYYYSVLDYRGGGGRFLTVGQNLQDDVLLVSLSGNSTTLYDPPERLNPEYSAFVSGLGFSNGTVSFENKLVLLDVRFVLVQQRNNVITYEAPGVGGFVSQGVLLDLDDAEEFFERELVSSHSFEPLSKVFTLPKTKPASSDYSVDEKNASEALRLASSEEGVAFETEFDERARELVFTAPESGFAFVSVMHYPLWKAYSNGKELRVLEAAGGLVAVEGVERGEKVVLRFEKPWYDYAAMGLSILGLLLVFLILARR